MNRENMFQLSTTLPVNPIRILVLHTFSIDNHIWNPQWVITKFP